MSKTRLEEPYFTEVVAAWNEVFPDWPLTPEQRRDVRLLEPHALLEFWYYAVLRAKIQKCIGLRNRDPRLTWAYVVEIVAKRMGRP